MQLCYQVATPDIAVSPDVTAFQGSIQHTFSSLAAMGFDGVELMTGAPKQLNWEEVKQTASQHGLTIGLVCTGEIFGQLGLSFTHPDEKVRMEAVERVCEIIDFAAFLNAKINIGRVRGTYHNNIPAETTQQWAVEAFRHISRYGAKQNVKIALEAVTYMQTNFMNTIGEIYDMVERVAEPNFGIMMDLFHMNIEEKNMFAVLKEFGKDTLHVHLADNNRRYPGACGLDFEKILSTLYNAGYNDTFCTEIYQLPNQDEAAKQTIRHLAPIFEKIYGRKQKATTSLG